MTTMLPPIAIVFDVDVILSGTTPIWQQYAKVGSCYVPEVVFEEIDFLSDEAATDKTRESLAREFLRFFPQSGWALTDAQETHPLLEPGAGSSQSVQARLMVATAHCVYGFALENPESLVVFVSNSQSLLKRMQGLGVINLCGITAAMLLNWTRKGERPIAVTQQLQQLMRSLVSQRKGGQETRLQTGDTSFGNARATSGKTGLSSGRLPTKGVPTTIQSKKSTTGLKQGHPAKNRSASKQKPAPRAQTADFTYETFSPRINRTTAPRKPGWLSHILNSLGALFFLSLAISVAWRTFDPVGFNNFWQRNIAPNLPQQIRQIIKT